MAPSPFKKILISSEKLVKEDISIIPKVAHPQQKNFSEVKFKIGKVGAGVLIGKVIRAKGGCET